MSVTDDLLRNNEAYAESFDKGDLPLPPAKKVAVVACMDARLDVHGLLGLALGDAHVIRNAGGVVTDDEIRSLAISQRLLGTEEIVLIHHTDCGMLTFTDDSFRADIQGDTGIKPPVVAGVLHRPRCRRPQLDRPHQGQPVHPEEGPGPRVRLRRPHRTPARGQPALSHAKVRRRPSASGVLALQPNRAAAADGIQDRSRDLARPPRSVCRVEPQRRREFEQARLDPGRDVDRAALVGAARRRERLGRRPRRRRSRASGCRRRRSSPGGPRPPRRRRSRSRPPRRAGPAAARRRSTSAAPASRAPYTRLNSAR